MEKDGDMLSQPPSAVVRSSKAIFLLERIKAQIATEQEAIPYPLYSSTGLLLPSSSPVQASRTLRSRFCNRTYNESRSIQLPTFDLCHSGKRDPC
ncbi:hypothetical protein MRB53_026731 [Persea americana]|uniref:Uncharacterized protein n=1 Tax=Persea americana TaxID=3435 RepID=A0ACC2LJF9_PERAE|nr:hypothetical protein MRB53_026731 [Persea americana]